MATGPLESSAVLFDKENTHPNVRPQQISLLKLRDMAPTMPSMPDEMHGSPPLSPRGPDDVIIEDCGEKSTKISELTEDMLAELSREELVEHLLFTQRQLVQSEENVIAWQSHATDLKNQGKDLYAKFVSKCHRLQRVSQLLKEARESETSLRAARDEADSLRRDAESQAKQQQANFKKNFDSYVRMKAELEAVLLQRNQLEDECQRLKIELASTKNNVSETLSPEPSSRSNASDSGAETLRIRCETLRSHNISLADELKKEKQALAVRESQLASLQLTLKQTQAESDAEIKKLTAQCEDEKERSRVLVDNVSNLTEELRRSQERAQEQLRQVEHDLNAARKSQQEKELSSLAEIQLLQASLETSNTERDALELTVRQLRDEASALHDDIRLIYNKHQNDLIVLNEKYQHDNYLRRFEAAATRCRQLEHQRDAALLLLQNKRENNNNIIDLQEEAYKWASFVDGLGTQLSEWRSRVDSTNAIANHQFSQIQKLWSIVRHLRNENHVLNQQLCRVRSEALVRLVTATDAAELQNQHNIELLESFWQKQLHDAAIAYESQASSWRDTIEFVQQESRVKTEQIEELVEENQQLRLALVTTEQQIQAVQLDKVGMERTHQQELSAAIVEVATNKLELERRSHELHAEFQEQLGLLRAQWLYELSCWDASAESFAKELEDTKIKETTWRNECDSLRSQIELLESSLTASKSQSSCLAEQVQSLSECLSATQFEISDVTSSLLAATMQLREDQTAWQLALEATERKFSGLLAEKECESTQLREHYNAALLEIDQVKEQFIRQSHVDLEKQNEQTSQLLTRIADLETVLEAVSDVWSKRLAAITRSHEATVSSLSSQLQQVQSELETELHKLREEMHQSTMRCSQLESVCLNQSTMLQSSEHQEQEILHRVRSHFEVEAARVRGLSTALENQLEIALQEKRDLVEQLEYFKYQLEMARLSHAELLLQLEHFYTCSQPANLLSASDKDVLTWQRHRTTLQLKLQQQDVKNKSLHRELEDLRQEMTEKEDNWREQVRLLRLSLLKAEDISSNFKSQLQRTLFFVDRAKNMLSADNPVKILLESSIPENNYV